MSQAHWIANTMTIAGHLSFLLTFLSYSQKSLIRLRMIAVASLLVGLTYNTWVNTHMPEGQDIHLVVAWLAVFLLQNSYLLFREIRDTLEVSLPADVRELLVATFPAMHSRDWQVMLAAAQKREFRLGDKLLNLGDPTVALQIIYSGMAEEVRSGSRKVCHKGVLWGELTYVLGEDYYNASPVDIVVTSTRLVMLEWPYPQLKKMASESLRFNAALQNGFVHSAGLKHGLLREDKTPKAHVAP